MEAAACGLPIGKVAAYEPPFVGDSDANGSRHEPELKRFIAEGNRSGAVQYFMRTMVGLPAPMVMIIRLMPWIWRKLEAVAHTLPYDAAVMGDWNVPAAHLKSIGVPTLMMHGSKTDAKLQKAALAAAQAIPGAQHRTLPGQTHNVKPQVLAPVLVEFFSGK